MVKFNKFLESIIRWRDVYKELFYQDLRLKEEQIIGFDEYQMEILTNRMTIYLVFAEDFNALVSFLKGAVLSVGLIVLVLIGTLHILDFQTLGIAIGLLTILPALKVYFFLRVLIYDIRSIQGFVDELTDNESVQEYLHYKIGKGKPVM